MRKTGLILVGLVLCVGFFVNVALAADKFAYVELSRIINEYSKTKDYDKTLGDKEAAYNADREKKVTEVKQVQEKMNLSSDKEKEAKKAELETKVKALQEFDQQKLGDIRKEYNEKRVEIMKDIDSAIKIYSAKEGYTLVFNEAGVVYNAANLNVTDKVLESLNKGYAPKK